MKKRLLLLVLLFLTGCSKSMKCSFVSDGKTMNTVQSYNIVYKKDIIKNIFYKVDYKVFDEFLNSNFSMLLSERQTIYNRYNISYDYKFNDNSYSISAFYDFSKLTDDVINELVGTKSVRGVKNDLLDKGFKCK